MSARQIIDEVRDQYHAVAQFPGRDRPLTREPVTRDKARAAIKAARKKRFYSRANFRLDPVK